MLHHHRVPTWNTDPFITFLALCISHAPSNTWVKLKQIKVTVLIKLAKSDTKQAWASDIDRVHKETWPRDQQPTWEWYRAPQS